MECLAINGSFLSDFLPIQGLGNKAKEKSKIYECQWQKQCHPNMTQPLNHELTEAMLTCTKPLKDKSVNFPGLTPIWGAICDWKLMRMAPLCKQMGNTNRTQWIKKKTWIWEENIQMGVFRVLGEGNRKRIWSKFIVYVHEIYVDYIKML